MRGGGRPILGATPARPLNLSTVLVIFGAIFALGFIVGSALP